MLGTSGIFINRTDCAKAAATIAAALLPQDAAARYQGLNAQNLQRWNRLAEDDRLQVARMVAALAEKPAAPGPVAEAHRSRR